MTTGTTPAGRATDRTERADQTDRAEQPDKADQAEQPDQADRPPGPQPASPAASRLAARVRRAMRSRIEHHGDDPVTRALTTALDRHDAPFALAITGGAGSGRHALARLLSTRRDWSPHVVDVDEAAADPPPRPDAELHLLCTAPCRHEELWRTRPRHHPLFVVVTRPVARAGTPAPWATGHPHLDPHAPDSVALTALLDALDAVERDLPKARARRLAAEVEALAADPELTDDLEPALCEAHR